MTATIMPIKVMSSAALLCVGIAAALPAAAQSDQEQLSRGIEAMLLEQGDRNALGTSDTPLTVSSPAQVRYELGAVVVAGDQGATVMAVTPGSAAEQLELQPGDRLLAINSVRLAGASNPVAALEKAVQGGEGRLKIEASRDGRNLQLQGQADVVAIPAYQVVIGASGGDGCGFVSSSAGPLPTSKSIYNAEITQIDGRSTPLRELNRHHVDAGRHLLTIRELIPRQWLSGTQIHQIKRMHRIKDADAYKTLVVEVEPGMRYNIGARLLRDQLDRESIRDNAYWEPVVWESVAERCD